MLPKFDSLISRVRRLSRNVTLDLRYGGFLGGTVRTPFAGLGIHDTASTDYDALPDIFHNAISPSDVLVDIGCGKGRVINWWLSCGIENQIVGIELDPRIAEETRSRLRNYPNVSIIGGDALLHLPENGTVFYLFNPFNESWMLSFKDRMAGFRQHRQAIRIFYYNCLYSDVFESDPAWIVEMTGLRHPFHRLAVIRPACESEMCGNRHARAFSNSGESL